MDAVFDAYDDDFDGVIDIENLGVVLRAGGLILTEADIKKICDEVDPEEKGTLALSDYFIIMARKYRDLPVVEQAAQTAFTKISKAAMIFKEKEDIPVTSIRNILIGKGGDMFSEKEVEDVMRYVNQLADTKAGTISMKVLQDWIFGRKPPDGFGIRSHPRPFEELLAEKVEKEKQDKLAKKEKKKAKKEKDRG